MSAVLENNAACDLEVARYASEPAVIVVFGATGDLAHRKIAPALHNLDRKGRLHEATRLVGFARRSLSDEEFRESLRVSVGRFSHAGLEEAAWGRFSPRITYARGEIDDPGAYASLAAALSQLGMPRNVLFYLAVSPDRFDAVASGLAGVGLGSAPVASGVAGGPSFRETAGGADAPWRRLVVEKPFGRDLASAHELNRSLQKCFAERDIFRIDHYLGKETVQNLLYFRFANSVFEPLWNRNHIERVEIDVLETGGIGDRGGYYDGAGAARDMLQNHLIQLLCLTAMEPPATLDPESIREEKVKVLRSIPTYREAELALRSSRGQYLAGVGADGVVIPDYRSEKRVASDSKTETFVSLDLNVDNWRFAGVPFRLRTGKALDRKLSEIRVFFKRPPETLFAGFCSDRLASNCLVIRIQPDEGIWLSFNSKQPGKASLVSGELGFSHREGGGAYFPEAYERLIDDALCGDSTLFIRFDETEEAWRLVDSLERLWSSASAPRLLGYSAGSAPPAPLR